jgi:hypothetical protein
MSDELTLLQKQFLFASLFPQLIVYCRTVLGYNVKILECLRSDEQALIYAMGDSGRKKLAQMIGVAFPALAAALEISSNGIVNSVHTKSLAVDLGLFKGDRYLADIASYQPAGIYWEGLHPLCRWGGRFSDGDHFSIEHDGRK